MVCSFPLKTERMTGPAETVPWYIKVPGGTMTVITLILMASTSGELTTAKELGGTDSTQLLAATRTSGLR